MGIKQVSLRAYLFPGANWEAARVGTMPRFIAGGRERHRIFGAAAYPKVASARPDAINLSIGDRHFSVDPGKPFTIGASTLKDDISIDLRAAGKLVRRLMLKDKHVQIERHDGKTWLRAKNEAELMVLRPGQEQGHFATFSMGLDAAVLLMTQDPAGEITLDLLDATPEGEYAVKSYKVPGITSRAKNSNSNTFELRDNDLILLPLGMEKEANHVLWLPVAFNESDIAVPVKETVRARPFSAIRGLEELETQALREIEVLDRSQKSYFKLLPEAAKTSVLDMVVKAIGEQKEEKEASDFIELMAKCWLIKEKVFQLYVEQQGYQLVKDPEREIAADEKVSFLCLTTSASVLAVGNPGQDQKRQILYNRLGLRPKTKIPDSFRIAIKPVQLGGWLAPQDNENAPIKHTSNVCRLAIRQGETPHADNAIDDGVALSQSFARVNSNTMRYEVPGS